MGILYLIIFLFGICVGSFLNCLIWRLNQKETILGRSMCPRCKKIISWFDNIPLVSFLILKGKCRSCKKDISLQYPLVELIVGLLFFLAAYKHLGAELNFGAIETSVILFILRDWLFISILTIIFVYDLRWYLILDIITLPAIAIAFGVNLYLGFAWIDLLAAAAIGGGFFFFQFVVSRGRWIGGGDIRLGFLMGMMLSWPQILTALMIAYVSGSVIGVSLLASGKKQWSSQIPFGTFLSAASAAALLWGEHILSWYLTWL
ncbi:MAG: prepilin peptidase [bacterium]|nr:prepilin peptidase [bacterium]